MTVQVVLVKTMRPVKTESTVLPARAQLDSLGMTVVTLILVSTTLARTMEHAMLMLKITIRSSVSVRFPKLILDRTAGHQFNVSGT